MKKSISFRRLCARKIISTGNLTVVLAAMYFLLNVAIADVTISPSSIYLSQNHKTGRFVIYNDSSGQKIINIKLNFGYPVSDEEGNITFKFFDSQTDSHAIRESWVSMYPRHFELGPQESQVIAITIKPPQNLPDGEYWLKPEVIIQPIVPDQQKGADKQNKHSVASKDEYRLIVGINYRQGNVQTGVNIHKIDASIRQNRMCIFALLVRLGNAAYRGSIICNLHDVNDKAVHSVQFEVAIYRTLTRRLEFDLSLLADGKYSAEVELNTNRPPRQLDEIIASPTVKDTISFSLKDGVVLQYQAKSQAINSIESLSVSDTSIKKEFITDNRNVLTLIGPQIRKPKVSNQDFYERAQALDRRLKELNREQDNILKELHQMNVILVH